TAVLISPSKTSRPPPVPPSRGNRAFHSNRPVGRPFPVFFAQKNDATKNHEARQCPGISPTNHKCHGGPHNCFPCGKEPSCMLHNEPAPHGISETFRNRPMIGSSV